MQISKISDQAAILEKRFCDLNLSFAGSWVQDCVEQLYEELALKNLKLRPHVWMSTEWFSPDGVPGIALPFYLFDKQLAELEANAIGEAEGVDRQWCMQLLRHEAGHAIDNAFGLRRNKERQKLFGLSTAIYPKAYKPNRKSKNFVIHLNDHYAQAHPDEDWAETFAVWLDPKSNWQQKYQQWAAIEKLKFVDTLMSSLKGQTPRVRNRQKPGSIDGMTQTLRRHYSYKLRSYTNTAQAYRKDGNNYVLM
jgi:hypothetical protein